PIPAGAHVEYVSLGRAELACPASGAAVFFKNLHLVPRLRKIGCRTESRKSGAYDCYFCHFILFVLFRLPTAFPGPSVMAANEHAMVASPAPEFPGWLKAEVVTWGNIAGAVAGTVPHFQEYPDAPGTAAGYRLANPLLPQPLRTEAGWHPDTGFFAPPVSKGIPPLAIPSHGIHSPAGTTTRRTLPWGQQAGNQWLCRVFVSENDL